MPDVLSVIYRLQTSLFGGWHATIKVVFMQIRCDFCSHFGIKMSLFVSLQRKLRRLSTNSHIKAY